jgi:hypothetical protein
MTMHEIIVVEQEEQKQQQHFWMMNPTRAVFPIIDNLVEKDNPFNFCNGYQKLQRSTT